jgi:hypothetical protein
MPDNPFEVLRLAPDVSQEEAVQQAGRLSQRAADEPTRNAIRQAIQELTSSTDEWTLQVLLTHPRPEYSRPELDRLIATFRRPPASSAEKIEIPGVDLEELRSLLLDALAEEQTHVPLPLERIEVVESAEEIARQTSEAVWQMLIADMRA